MTKPERGRVDAYLDTVERLEPEIAMIDAGAAYASIAISLKRIADAMEYFARVKKHRQQINKNQGRGGVTE